MSHKSWLIATIVFFASFLAVIAVLSSSFNILQAINPIAALTATTVALIGMIWFKRSSTS